MNRSCCSSYPSQNQMQGAYLSGHTLMVPLPLNNNRSFCNSTSIMAPSHNGSNSVGYSTRPRSTSSYFPEESRQVSAYPPSSTLISYGNNSQPLGTYVAYQSKSHENLRYVRGGSGEFLEYCHTSSAMQVYNNGAAPNQGCGCTSNRSGYY